MNDPATAHPWLRRLWRRFLRLDEVVPPLPSQEVEQEVERNYRWNFTVNLLDGVVFWFGLNLISTRTIMPLFLNRLTPSHLPIAILAIIGQSAWALPQLFTANMVEKAPRMKPIAVNLGFFTERLPLWLLAFSALLAADYPRLTVWLVLFFFGWHAFGAGVIATAWQELIARCFPVNKRGFFFGLSNFIGTGIGVVSGGISAAILKDYPFPQNFFYLFLAAAFLITLSWVFLSLTREPPVPHAAPEQGRTLTDFLRELPDLLRHDRNYRNYLISTVWTGLGNMGLGFVTVAALERWSVSDATVGYYTSAMLFGQTIGNLLFGVLGDRYGHKANNAWGGAFLTGVAFLVAMLAPSPAWFYLVFFLLGLALGAWIVSGTMITMEFGTPERRPTYIGLTRTLTGVIGILSPLIGMGLAEVGYTPLFAASALTSFLGWAYLQWKVAEPRAQAQA